MGQLRKKAQEYRQQKSRKTAQKHKPNNAIQSRYNSDNWKVLHEEIKEFSDRNGLLELASQDAGERGQYGKKFYKCPICNHHENFIVNVENGKEIWCCHSSRSTPEPNQKKLGGDVIDYLKHRHKLPNRGSAIEYFYKQIIHKPYLWIEKSGYTPNRESQMKTISNNSLFKKVEFLEQSDKEYSRLFGKYICDKVVFVDEEKGYRVYNGKAWIKDTNNSKIEKLAKQFSDELCTYAKSISNEKKGTFEGYALRYGSHQKRHTLIKDTQCEVRKSISEFDTNEDLLNLQNGTFNLNTYKLQPHNPNDFLTRTANVVYDESAKCPEWDKFLSQTFQGNIEVIRYVQKITGLCLTAETKEETMFLFLGKTRSGKSCLIGTLLELLNPKEREGYSLSCQPETFAIKRFHDSSKPSPEVARFHGCRFLEAQEPSLNMPFNVAFLKQITGNDEITARFLGENIFQFKPKLKLIMAANSAPQVNDMTLFESDRINVIPFNNHVKAKDRDKSLKERFRKPENLSGIFNFFLEGLRMYRAEGLIPPKTVRDATEHYWKESDKIRNFFSMNYERNADSALIGKDVYNDYLNYTSDVGLDAEGKQEFFAILRKRGLLSKRGTVAGIQQSNVIKGYRKKLD